jgi:hypothetical protein
MHDLRPQGKWAKKADNTILSVVLPAEIDVRIADVMAAIRENLGAQLSHIAQSCSKWNKFEAEQPVVIDTKH